MPLLNEQDLRTLAEKPVFDPENSIDLHNPPEEMQISFTGTSFLTAYTEAAAFLNYVFERIEADSGPVNFDGMRIVDFGAGWGRMLRLLRSKPELDGAILYGFDQHPRALRVCQQSLPRVWLSRTGSYPPCDLRSGFIDLVYAYSVFSHLNEPPHLAWAQEIHRILKPGGYACVTVQAREFIIVCKEFREGTREMKNDWHRALAGAFTDVDDCLRRYDAGELVFNFTGGAGMDVDVYGDAVAPKAFFEKHWSRFGFRLVDWFDRTRDVPQSRVLLQKLP